ncbi:hypothetical protein O181_116833 [Austropuccinia psidii MF-1]|uniref:Uncharacterized protein n=1 Tax=Austropuccinia psidii MF-1 TaxID=1389203 RepID=A0A9Q3K964_9BASI|nr:hypothetical protein [Austropuccinia psidii MF-1]
MHDLWVMHSSEFILKIIVAYLGLLHAPLEDPSREVEPREPHTQQLIGLSNPHGMGGLLCSNLGTFGIPQWSNDPNHNGEESLATGPASVCFLDGAGPLDSQLPPPLSDEG